jgi:hypothetical protein
MTDQESTPQAAPEAKPAPEPKPDETPKGKPEGFDSLPPETQQEIKNLRSESAKWRIEAQQRQEKLEEYEEANRSELEKAQAKATKLEQKAQEAEARLLKYEVAAEKQIPADAMDLLVGKTREELEAKADKLLALVKSRSDTDKPPDFDGGAREPAPDTDPETAHNQLVARMLLGDVTRT